MRPRFSLDTSGVYYILHGHTLMKQVVAEAVGDGFLQVSKFVCMEYLRGMIVAQIELYSLIKESLSVDDALIDWSQGFSQRDKKFVLLTISRWITGQDDWQNKATTLRRLGTEIVRMVEDFDQAFGDQPNKLQCQLGPLVFPRRTFDEDLLFEFYQRFHAIFNGTPQCRLCLFRTSQINQLNAQGVDLCGEQQRQKYRQFKGYVKQAEQLERAVATREELPQCRWCEKLGDSLVTLQSSPKDILIAVDRAFVPLAELLGRRKRKRGREKKEKGVGSQIT